MPAKVPAGQVHQTCRYPIIDKTHTDLQGSLCLEPVTFTFGIFNRHVRHQPEAWRDLGFIPNQAVLQPGDGKGKDKGINKATNYHYKLGTVLEGLVAIETVVGSDGTSTTEEIPTR